MKKHTTNYTNTFIEIAEDCPALLGEVPPVKADKKSIANLHFDMIYEHPYKYTSDEVIFHGHASKKDLIESELVVEKELFFSKGQACLRTSPLTKRFGWGVHHNSEGKIAIYGVETEDYQKFVTNNTLKTVKAMRSKKA